MTTEQKTVQTPFVILDTEYTSWKGCIDSGWDESEGQFKELVQIAAVKVDDGREVDTFDKFVRPHRNPTLSDYFKNLTGITQCDVDTAGDFSEVFEEFKDWLDDLPVYSYGYDAGVIEYNIDLYNAEVTINHERYHDIRPVFDDKGVNASEYTSGTIAEVVNGDIPDGEPHNALYDCRSILFALQTTKSIQND